MKLHFIFCGVLLLPMGAAVANPSERIAGNYVCLNNPAPECRNVERIVTPGFACINNPDPACRNPPRPQGELVPGSWQCRSNQNVKCGNPVRYSVEDQENWAEHFERSGSNSRAESSRLR
jgi:hypothetical protein